MEYRLVEATASDVDWLENLRRTVYQDLFQATWGGWDEARHQRQLGYCLNRGHISIIEVGGSRVGMIQVLNELDAVEVGEIQIQPRDQNRGIGATVLLGIIAMAHSYGKRVSLRVGLKNDRACRLYRRLGFQQVAKTETHFHMGCEPKR
jgi:ribosomal protein S18 acetylase RimI-like enzyme